MDLISVIIPVYNVEQYLKQSIESVLNQTYYNLEILIINDGSTDTSGAICDRFAEKDKRISVIHKENGGVSSARNVGIERATGKYLSFIDSDDYIRKEYCEILITRVQEYDAQCSAVGQMKFYESDGHMETVSQSDAIKIQDGMEALDDAMSPTDLWLGFATNKLFLKEIVDESQIRFNENLFFCEDSLFCYKYVVHCKRCVRDTTPLYVYRIRDTSITQSMWKEREKLKYLLDAADILYGFMQPYKGRKCFLQASNFCQSTYIRYIFYMFQNSIYDKADVLRVLSKINYVVSECKSVKFSFKEKAFYKMLTISPYFTYHILNKVG